MFLYRSNIIPLAENFDDCIVSFAELTSLRVIFGHSIRSHFLPLQVWLSHLSCTAGKSTILSRDMRKPAFCICENKDADQLRSNCAADECLCFRYTDSTISLLPKSEISSP